MTRRAFLQSALATLSGFAILPPATTYTRLWKATYTHTSPYYPQVKTLEQLIVERLYETDFTTDVCEPYEDIWMSALTLPSTTPPR